MYTTTSFILETYDFINLIESDMNLNSKSSAWRIRLTSFVEAIYLTIAIQYL